MNLFFVHPDSAWADKAKAGTLSGSHKCGLPGLTCDACGPWATTGLQYLDVDVPTIQRAIGGKSAWPVTAEEFRIIRQRVSIALGDNRLLRPGTQFGAVSGTARGQFGDFGWVNPWTILCRSPLVSDMQERRLKFFAAVTEFQYRPKDQVPFHEIEALPFLKVTAGQLEFCSICGRNKSIWNNKMKLSRSSWNRSLDIQRIAEFPTMLVASERFRDFCVSKRLTDVTFTSAVTTD